MTVKAPMVVTVEWTLCSMDRAQCPSKLPTSLCEVEDYYSSDSSSTSLEKVIHSEVEVKSSKTFVILLITIGTNSLEDKMDAMKTMLAMFIKANKEKRGVD